MKLSFCLLLPHLILCKIFKLLPNFNQALKRFQRLEHAL